MSAQDSQPSNAATFHSSFDTKDVPRETKIIIDIFSIETIMDYVPIEFLSPGQVWVVPRGPVRMRLRAGGVWVLLSAGPLYPAPVRMGAQSLRLPPCSFHSFLIRLSETAQY